MKDKNLINNTEETLFTKANRDGRVSYIEQEVEQFDFADYELVRGELLPKANCPAVTFKYGTVQFNIKAVRKLGECSHIQLLMNMKKKLMIAKSCDEDDRDSLQWSRINKHQKLQSRQINGRLFSAQVYQDMKWNNIAVMKMLGTTIKCKNEKILVFNLINAEAYLHLADADADSSKRRKRIPFMPEHWQGHYGQPYTETLTPIIETFEGIPEGFVKITLPALPSKKLADETKKLVKATEENSNNKNKKDGDNK